jgi:hypothetical protein
MSVLPMATTGTIEIPPILLEHPQNIANFHSTPPPGPLHAPFYLYSTAVNPEGPASRHPQFRRSSPWSGRESIPFVLC